MIFVKKAVFGLLVGAVASAGLSTQVLASTCKGMEQEACQSASGCYWVDPYERKDGVKVAGHCRGKPDGKKGKDDDKSDKKQPSDDKKADQASKTKSEQ